MEGTDGDDRRDVEKQKRGSETEVNVRQAIMKVR